MTAAERGIRRRQRLFVVFTAVLVLAYARQLVNAPTAGQDFRAFFAAATLAAHGGDPYDWTALGHTEEALYNSPGHIRVGDAAYYDFLPYPEGPWLALALEPLTGLSWRAEILSHWRAAQGSQPDIASIHSFYYPALSGPFKTIALLLVVLAGCAYAAWALGRVRSPLAKGLTVLLLWFALLPYVHSFDAILLLPLLAVLVAADQRGWGNATTEATVWAFAIIPFAYFVGWHVLFFNGFTAIPMAMLLLAWHRRVVMRSPSEIAPARAA